MNFSNLALSVRVILLHHHMQSLHLCFEFLYFLFGEFFVFFGKLEVFIGFGNFGLEIGDSVRIIVGKSKC